MSSVKVTREPFHILLGSVSKAGFGGRGGALLRALRAAWGQGEGVALPSQLPRGAPSARAWRVLEPSCAWWVHGPGGPGTCRFQWVSEGASRGLGARGLPASWFPWGLRPHGPHRQPCPPRAPKPLGLPFTCSRPAPPYSPGGRLGPSSLRRPPQGWISPGTPLPGTDSAGRSSGSFGKEEVSL